MYLNIIIYILDITNIKIEIILYNWNIKLNLENMYVSSKILLNTLITHIKVNIENKIKWTSSEVSIIGNVYIIS